MSYAPQTLLDARAYLREFTGLPWVSLGIVGSTTTHFTGYHLGWDRIRLNQGRSDYSIRESSRDANPTNAAMALDIGQFSRGDKTLGGLSRWLVQQAQANAPDTRDIREIIYTPDGKTVRRYDRLKIRTGGDNTHLTHTHISYFRDSESRDKTALFRRYFEGGDDVELNDTVKMTDKAGNRYSYGRAAGADSTTVNGALGAARGAFYHLERRAIPALARIEATLKVIAGQDPATAVREEIAKVTSSLVEAVNEAVPEANQAMVEAALRSVLGELDEG